MKKGWRVILVIVLVAILLGAVCVGVGLMTGGDMPRILEAMDERLGRIRHRFRPEHGNHVVMEENHVALAVDVGC